MELILITILSTLVLCFSIISAKEIVKGYKHNSKRLTFILLIYSFVIFLLLFFYLTKPTAIDVYRGKTTLEITYKDKIPIDSTVVWKNR